MNKSENYIENFTYNNVAKNTIYNLLGYCIPLLLAVFFIPSLIKGLGEERFGILNIIWIVIGYFSFFDFGIGRTLTKIIAEKVSSNQTRELPGIFWTSFLLMFGISILGTVLLSVSVPFLVHKFFNISNNLEVETLRTFYALTISIPIVSTTAGLRGVLEAYQKFAAVNIIRIFLGVSTFLGPLICLFLTNSLFYIVVVLIFIRIIIWGLYLYQCFKVNPHIRNEFKYAPELIKPVLKMSTWITTANMVGPLIIYVDRFLIGSLISVAAITYYATPYEVVTKLLLIPNALTGVLFPIFSSSHSNDTHFSKRIFFKGVKFIFLILYPVVLVIVTFAYEGMKLWLGDKFAIHSSLILQLLSVGVLLNSITYIPFNYLQGIGKPKIPALIYSAELPIYVVIMLAAVKKWGINGAAYIWVLRVIVDTLLMFLIANKFLIQNSTSKSFIYNLLLLTSLLIIPFFLIIIWVKCIFIFIALSILSFLTWKYFLDDEEKEMIFLRLKMIIPLQLKS